MQTSTYPVFCEPFTVVRESSWTETEHFTYIEAPKESPNPCCPTCGTITYINRWNTVSLRALPVSTFVRTWWIVKFRRYICPFCGETFNEEIPFRFVGPKYHGSMLNNELAIQLWKDIQMTTIKDIVAKYSLPWNLLKEVDIYYMQRAVDAAGLPENTRFLGIDENQIGSENGKLVYITVIIDIEAKRPIWCCKGKKIVDVEPFFSWFGKNRLKKIEAVAMDANAGYSTLFRKNCTHAKQVLDHFHMILDYGRDCMDKVRLRISRSLVAEDPKLAKIFKDTNRIPISRPENLSENGLKRLNKMRKANQEFNDCI